jgi:hypothetical protein
MIYKIFKIDLLDFQGFNSLNFRKPTLFEYKFFILRLKPVLLPQLLNQILNPHDSKYQRNSCFFAK